MQNVHLNNLMFLCSFVCLIHYLPHATLQYTHHSHTTSLHIVPPYTSPASSHTFGIITSLHSSHTSIHRSTSFNLTLTQYSHAFSLQVTPPQLATLHLIPPHSKLHLHSHTRSTGLPPVNTLNEFNPFHSTSLR